MILTNDGEFSESLTEPAQKVGKRYLVEVDGLIGQEMVEVFEEGMWFAKEEITTAPAKVELIEDSRCRLIIYEGNASSGETNVRAIRPQGDRTASRSDRRDRTSG